ncbi:uncharacterized protein BO88DRAFT_25256 [Aspergillus vadensis CBS 113365]|uniref:Uncharacterized protein n=1 Tax=Aspergillus vadensis (strain CBS 113365 / IMI 142717 / IBT 24658) TaxID=1448311 RepID=A0A319BQC5_ASPVC|nr:hypothetical protein BO88DRAFT_25256 [Aspergillus vadensis CBS 113365]PYH74905.1 hypothetical protein BO88DRAFT_25256 [Aspergillus vadensis CBS 113365]
MKRCVPRIFFLCDGHCSPLSIRASVRLAWLGWQNGIGLDPRGLVSRWMPDEEMFGVLHTMHVSAKKFCSGINMYLICSGWGEESLLHQGINACRRCLRSNSMCTHSLSVHAENRDEPLCLVVPAQGSTPSHLHLLPAPVGLPILHGLAHFVSASWPGRNSLSTTMQLCLV